MKLSIVIPCKNEEGNVIHLYDSIKDTFKNQNMNYEIIYIDDGSEDETLNNLKDIYEKDKKHIKIISFSKNFKKEAAMLAGLTHSSGEYTCILDGDMQQNPNYLIKMIEFLDENKEYDEVAMVMEDRTYESKIMAFFKKVFYKTMNKLSDVHLEENASDFRMFRKNVRDAVISLSEKNRFQKGIFSWVGFNIKYMPYKVEKRLSGKTSFGFKSSLKYALDGVFAFSTKPLKLSVMLGILSIISFFMYLIIVLFMIITKSFVFNFAHIIIMLLLLLFGIEFILIGIMGEYLAKTYIETKNRPVYIIKEKIGFKD